MASSRPLSLFPELHDSGQRAPVSAPGQNAPVSASGQSTPVSAPVFTHVPCPDPNSCPISFHNLPTMSVEQMMAVQSDMKANSYTLRSCVETIRAVSDLSARLQNRTTEVYQLSAQLALLQNMYKDSRGEISELKTQNKELRRQVTSMVRFGVPLSAGLDVQQGTTSFGNPAYSEAGPSKRSRAETEVETSVKGPSK